MSPRTAWVESPLQMISAIEASSAGLFGRSTDIVYRRDLTSTAELAARLASVPLPHGVSLHAAPPSSLWRRSQIDAFGDAFSGAVQARRLAARPHAAVLLDDGLATLHVIDLLTRSVPAPLIRARAEVGTMRRQLGLIARAQFVHMMRQGRLTVFTGLPVPEDLESAFARAGGLIQHHAFQWSASLRGPELHGAGTVVVGAAMASDGLVDPGSYVRWVHDIAESTDDEVVYIPHRRESTAITAQVADRTSIRVERGPWPVEISLRCLPPGSVVHCLPSTPLLTLRGVLRESGVSLIGHQIPESWWTPHATQQFRTSIASIMRQS